MEPIIPSINNFYLTPPLLHRKRRRENKPTYRILAGNPSPEISSWVKPHRQTNTAGLPTIFNHNIIHLPLNIGKGIERNISDLILDTVFLEPETSAREEHIGFSRSGEVGNPVTDEDYEGDGAIFRFYLGLGLVFVDG